MQLQESLTLVSMDAPLTEQRAKVIDTVAQGYVQISNIIVFSVIPDLIRKGAQEEVLHHFELRRRG